MERNVTLDYFKLLLSILVITIHTNFIFTDKLTWFISSGIARIAVPSFFIINGYYLSFILYDEKKVKKYLLHLLCIYFVWVAIQLPFMFDNPSFSKKGILIEVFTSGIAHLWYIHALIVATLILYFLKNLNKNVVLFFIYIFYFVGYILTNFYEINNRNFLFFGLPFLYLGFYINSERVEYKIMNIRGLQVLFLLCLLLFIFEVIYSFFLYYNENIFRGETYLSLPLLCPLLFLLILKKSKMKEADGYISKLATAIYFLHILVMNCVRAIFKYSYTDLQLFPIILFFSFIIAAIVLSLNKKIKIFL